MQSREKRDEDNKDDEDETDDVGVVPETEVKHLPRVDEDTTSGEERQRDIKSTDPPESQFVHLGPSRNRYTILKDEF